MVRSRAERRPKEHYLTRDVVRDLYVTGVRDPSLIDPEQWQAEYSLLQRHGAGDISLDLLYDIRTNGPTLKSCSGLPGYSMPDALIVILEDQEHVLDGIADAVVIRIGSSPQHDRARTERRASHAGHDGGLALQILRSWFC